MKLSAVPVLLAHATPRVVADGSLADVRLAGGGARHGYRYLGERWAAGLVALPTIVSRLGYSDDGWGAGAIPQGFQLQWAGSRVADYAAMAAYYWRDAEVVVRTGPDGGADADFSLLQRARVREVSHANDVMSLMLSDPAADLLLPVLADYFDGSGGAEGGEGIAGKPKRRAWGQAFNIEGWILDAATNVYCFGHPGHAWESFVDVKDMGASASSLTVVAWAGDVESTLTALKAASAPAGGAAVAPSIACVKWWTQPAGSLTADVEGENAGGYVETVAAIAERLVATRSTIAFATGVLAAAAAWRPDPAGHFVESGTETIASSLNRLLGGASLLWAVDAEGDIVIREWAWGASVAALRSDSVSRPTVHPPHKSRLIGYNVNNHVHSPGDIAAVPGGDVAELLEARPVTVYKRSYTQPTALTTEPGIPAGTVDIAPKVGLGLLWMSQSKQQADGTVIGTWSEWVQLETDPGFTLKIGPDTGTANDATYEAWLDGWRITAVGSLPGDYASIITSEEVFTGPVELHWQIADPAIEQRMGLIDDDTRTATLTSYGLGYSESAVAPAATVIRPVNIPIVNDFDGEPIDYGAATNLTKYAAIYDGLYMSYLIDGTPQYSEYVGPGRSFRMLFNSGTVGAGAFNVRMKAAAQREVPIEAIQPLGPLSFLNGIMKRVSPTGPDDWFMATFYTVRGFKGAAVAQGFVPDNTDKVVFGLHPPGADPADPRDTAYAVETMGDGTFRITEGGTEIVAPTAFANNDHFAVRYEGTEVAYLHNGSELDTTTVAAGLTLRLMGAINNDGGEIRDLVCAPVA